MTEHTAPTQDDVSSGVSELEDIKRTVMDSGDLANRAALLATTATTDLRTVTQQLGIDMAKQQKQVLMLMGIGGA